MNGEGLLVYSDGKIYIGRFFFFFGNWQFLFLYHLYLSPYSSRASLCGLLIEWQSARQLLRVEAKMKRTERAILLINCYFWMILKVNSVKIWDTERVSSSFWMKSTFLAHLQRISWKRGYINSPTVICTTVSPFSLVLIFHSTLRSTALLSEFLGHNLLQNDLLRVIQEQYEARFGFSALQRRNSIHW